MAANSEFQLIQGRGWQGGLSTLMRLEFGRWFGTRLWLWQALMWTLIINGILAGISSRTSTVSTTPDFSTGAAYLYGAYFQISREGRPWKGFLVRQKVTASSDGSWDWAQEEIKIAGPGPDFLDHDSSGTFAGLAFEPDQDLTIATRLILPAQAAGVPLAGDPLEATIFSLYPAEISWDEEPVFSEGGAPVAAGPALITLIPKLKEGNNGELRIVVHIPNNQTTPWFQMRFTTPGLRARCELLDVAWAELAWAQGLAVTEEELAAVTQAAVLSRQTWPHSTPRLWGSWKTSWRCWHPRPLRTRSTSSGTATSI